MMTLAIPVFIGLASLATEGALLFYNHRSVQSAADAAAYSAAISYSIDGNISNATTQAQAIVGSYGFAVGTGTGQANVTLPNSPDTATYAGITAINANVCRAYEPVARAMLDAGWEFMGHGVVQGAMHLLPDQRAAIWFTAPEPLTSVVTRGEPT